MKCMVLLMPKVYVCRLCNSKTHGALRHNITKKHRRNMQFMINAHENEALLLSLRYNCLIWNKNNNFKLYDATKILDSRAEMNIVDTPIIFKRQNANMMLSIRGDSFIIDNINDAMAVMLKECDMKDNKYLHISVMNFRIYSDSDSVVHMVITDDTAMMFITYNYFNIFDLF